MKREGDHSVATHGGLVTAAIRRAGDEGVESKKQAARQINGRAGATSGAMKEATRRWPLVV